MKKSDPFHWMEEAQKAPHELKTLIIILSVLGSPEKGETRVLYVTTTTQVVSVALVVEWEELEYVNKVQRPVYYISKVLSGYEIHYNKVQKLLYVILIMKRKLLHYFKSHLVRVVTSHGLREIAGNRLTMGRITKWALELMGLDKTYVVQMAIKSQALADFVAKWTETQQLPARWPRSTRLCTSTAPSTSMGWGRCRSNLPQGGSTPLCDSATFLRDKLHGRI
jgi:hypothetical protein